MDYKKLIENIINNIGGADNVDSVQHCATRLRFQLKNRALADDEAIKAIDGVMGMVYANGQYQVILGKHLLPAFEILNKNYKFNVNEVIDENLDNEQLTVKTVLQRVINYIAGSITPFIPALIAGGMIKVLLTLIGLVTKDFSSTQTYLLLNTLADAPFYFMPVFVAYGASRYLKCSPVYAILVAVAFVHPSYVSLLAEGTSVFFAGIGVRMVSYSSQIIPTLLSTYLVYWVEKFFNKIIPGIVKPVFVGMCTILVGYVATLFVLGPIGNLLGTGLMNLLVWINTTFGPVGVGILTAALPYLIITGTHSLAGPLIVQSVATLGYDAIFRPALMLHAMADGGSCLGVALKTKNKDLRSEAMSCALAAVLGVGEPGLFAIGLAHKTPLIANSIGGFVGGTVAGLLGAKAFSVGYASILALPIFETTIIAMSVAIIVTMAVSTIASFLLFKKEA